MVDPTDPQYDPELDAMAKTTWEATLADDKGRVKPWEDLHPDAQDGWRDWSKIARAALDAYREQAKQDAIDSFDRDVAEVAEIVKRRGRAAVDPSPPEPDHLQVYVLGQPFQCRCGKHYNSQRALDEHIATTTEPAPPRLADSLAAMGQSGTRSDEIPVGSDLRSPQSEVPVEPDPPTDRLATDVELAEAEGYACGWNGAMLARSQVGWMVNGILYDLDTWKLYGYDPVEQGAVAVWVEGEQP